ncbi:hypothetical protein LTR66_005823 [Elasticomyces elasticus]|nr:hypothetical protein LTR66_005823 [Elasticomyces elasticus]
MDVAYDHIQEEVLSPDKAIDSHSKQSGGLNSEFQEAFKAVSSSPWGARLGGFFGQVKKQGESLYTDAQKEYTAASETATRGLTSLVSRTRALSITNPTAAYNPDAPAITDDLVAPPKPKSSTTATSTEAAVEEGAPERPESLPADIVKEATTLVSRFRSEAAKRLKEIEKAEDAADEALLKFGTNIRDFLREAVTIAPPGDEAYGNSKNGHTGANASQDVLFETSDAEGKRVFHSTRFEAQLHVIHTTPSSFLSDPESAEYAPFAQTFDVERETDAIARDLDKFEELRRAMEKLVPERVDYALFWKRYYFLRKVVETEEERRREVLRGAAADTEEEVAWDDDDDDDDDDDTATPNALTTTSSTTKLTQEAPSPPLPNPPSDAKSTPERKPPVATTTTTTPPPTDLLKPAEPRRPSEEDGKSSASGSDTSYDILSGATSRAPGSPKEEKRAERAREESDEEDWE